MRFLVMVLSFLFVALPVRAEDIYFCSQEIFAIIEDGELKRFKGENFRLKITQKEITFGESAGYVSGSKMPIDLKGDEKLWASDESSILTFDGKNLYYSDAFMKRATMFFATCDKF